MRSALRMQSAIKPASLHSLNGTNATVSKPVAARRRLHRQTRLAEAPQSGERNQPVPRKGIEDAALVAFPAEENAHIGRQVSQLRFAISGRCGHFIWPKWMRFGVRAVPTMPLSRASARSYSALKRARSSSIHSSRNPGSRSPR